ncbi:MAG: maleylpyruvate isomerase family mycothiol-dependent enzyme [Nocardioidaceae bacterium]
MSLPTIDFLATITEHSAGFAAAAEANLDAQVEHCPGWTVADLVHHLTSVHWFWATIVEELLSSPPSDDRRPDRAEPARLISVFQDGAAHLVAVLAAADQADTVYTWAPAQHDVAFVTRHQVQEAAVHHWDAVHATGSNLTIAAPVAADSVEEFLTFSMSSDTDPADPPRPALDARFALRCSGAGPAWTISDGGQPGTVAHEAGAPADVPGIVGTASDLLLWLYQRVPLPSGEVPAETLARFRALCFTD